ncbi:sulfurtransferase complex subunit TusC [Endozoicomonas sp. SM1973]|uniref:Sulfurtransferase complex subunit TusC n=1 Tax=Spartinivicinus marinus TaxID=2994442 RepID=A0A853I3W0_9GAMM|nr:sulfurtransferase complex subunit TusC [Spartinivicinus marinus]MCX4029008.1 sulfurtransferase complex subunit TusC [Spartinivicinus marinus]NYZ65408.1 sulfurtransferase complex subunit TusC [Spartinivicinus marinus]
MKSLCIVSQQSPYASPRAKEALDAALVAATFDIPTTLVLLGDGVFQAIKTQAGEKIQQKNLGKQLAVLPMYDIEVLYVSEQDLSCRGLKPEQLMDNVQVLPGEQISELIRQQDMVISL